MSGLGLFLIYRQVASVLGVAMLGVWALVLATSAFGRAADFGIAAGLSRFIAKALGEGRPEQALAYMRTGCIVLSGAMGVVALILWWPLWNWLSIALDGAELEAARAVLPWAILSFWLLIVKTGLDSSLVGVHRADLRSMAGIAGMLVQVTLTFALLREHGLFGLAWAQAAQFGVAVTMELAFLMTVARIRNNARAPWFSWTALKEMLGLGVKLQVGTVANLVFEPAVKTVIAATAGTHVLGIFEMAYRTSYQVRNVGTMALQPTVAAFASLTARGQDESRELFGRVARTASLATAILMIGVVAGSPLIGWLYLGHVDPFFVYSSGILALMWGTTIVASPAYYFGIAVGRVAPYVVGEILAVVISCLAAAGLGMTGSATAIVAGACVGKVIGSLVLAAFTRPGKEWSTSILLRRDTWLSFAALLAIAAPVIWVALRAM